MLILISLNHYVLVDLAAVKKADPILHIKNKIASGEPLGNFVIKTKLPKGSPEAILFFMCSMGSAFFSAAKHTFLRKFKGPR